MSSAARPLAGVEVLALGGIGPTRFAVMTLADLGARVRLIQRPGTVAASDRNSHLILDRGAEVVVADLKDPADVSSLLSGMPQTDIVLEGFRPGVAEKLGLGPDEVRALNPALVYGRMTGWGQTGPLADRAGHDINYLAVSGALGPIVGSDGAPVPPLNLLGDFGGGAMYLVVGVLAGLIEARRTGHGCVVDAAIVDGAAAMTAMLHSMRATGDWDAPPGGNTLDGGAPFYGVYRCADGRWVAVGSLEPKFYTELVQVLGIEDEFPTSRQYDRTAWPSLRERLTTVFAGRTQPEWVQAFEGRDACFSPVVDAPEVLDHPHLRERGVYHRDNGYIEPAVAPRFH